MNTRRTWIIALVVVAGMAIPIGISKATGIWNTQSRRVPATYRTGSLAGLADPGDIRGSYTLADVERAFAVPANTLAAAFGLTGAENPAELRLSTLEEMYGVQPDGGEIGTDSVRLFVSIYTGRPYTPEPDTVLPDSAVTILETGAVVTGVATDDGPAEREANLEDHETNDRVVRGPTTFDNLYEWGLTRDQIEEVLGIPAGPRPMTVRDYLAREGLSFGQNRVRLQELVDAVGDGAVDR